MKKYLPFVFPALALVITIFLAYKWYSVRTARPNELSRLGEGVMIEDLSNTASTSSMIKGSKDAKTAQLTGEGEVSGEVRYEIKDGKVYFMVTALLPEQAGSYQVWLKSPQSEEMKLAFSLVAGKGGWMGTGAVNSDVLPVEVIVTRETRPDMTPETVVLKGTIAQ